MRWRLSCASLFPQLLIFSIKSTPEDYECGIVTEAEGIPFGTESMRCQCPCRRPFAPARSFANSNKRMNELKFHTSFYRKALQGTGAIYMRRAVYGIAVAALVINTLMPRAIGSTPRCQSAGNIQSAGAPQSQQQLRASGRAFSCPPLPTELDSHGVIPEEPPQKALSAIIGPALTYVAALSDSSHILLLQCRLNI